MTKRKFTADVVENYKRLKTMNSFNKYVFFSKKKVHNISQICRNNTIDILQNNMVGIIQSLKEIIPTKNFKKLPVFLSKIKSMTYILDLNEVMLITTLLELIKDDDIEDVELYDKTYDEYDEILDNNIIRIQRWYRRMKFTKKLWILIEKVVEVYYHPNSKHMERFMRSYCD